MRWFSGGVMCGLIAEHTVLFAVPLLIYQNTKSIAYAGTAFALEWLPALIMYPFAGLLADLLGGRFLFLKANLARAACLLIATLCCWLAPSSTVIVLIINGILLSTLMAPIRMAVEKTVPRLAAGDRLSRTQSTLQNIELLAMALGPGLAAGLAQWVGKLPLLGLAGAAFLVAAWCWRSLPTSPRQMLNPRRVGHDLLLGWRLLLGNPPVIRLAVVNFSINFAFAVAISANAYLITSTFGASDTVFGLMNAGAGALGLLNLLLIPPLLARWSIYRVGAVGFTTLCAGLVSMGLAVNVWVYVFSFLAAMGGVALFNVFNRTQRIKAIEPEHLGKVIGPFYLITCSSYPLGGVVTASLGQVISIQHIVLVMALLLATLGGSLLWATARYFRQKLAAKVPVRSPDVVGELVPAGSSAP